jgi:hypothetical protein
VRSLITSNSLVVQLAEIITLSKHLAAFYFVLFFVLVHSKHCYFVYLEYGISYCSPNLYYDLTLNEQYISHIINQNKLRLINQKLCNRMTLGPLYYHWWYFLGWRQYLLYWEIMHTILRGIRYILSLWVEIWPSFSCLRGAIPHN